MGCGFWSSPTALQPRRGRENDMSNRVAGDGEPRADEPTLQGQGNQPHADVERPAAQWSQPAEASNAERSAGNVTWPADTQQPRHGASDDASLAAADGADRRRSGRRPKGPAHARKGSGMQTLKRIWSATEPHALNASFNSRNAQCPKPGSAPAPSKPPRAPVR